jgi:DNA-directed RNA polymerase specialized sigma subunit
VAGPADDDAVLSAIDRLIEAFREVQQTHDVVLERAAHIREQRAARQSYRDIVPGEQRPLIVELATESVQQLIEAGARLRRLEAQVLYREGLTMEQIGALFGVSRQRIAELLQDDAADKVSNVRA